MAHRPAPALLLREADREKLERLTRASSARVGRARIVLLVADVVPNTAIAAMTGMSRPTVIGWRERYLARGIAGLHDERRPGRPRTIAGH